MKQTKRMALSQLFGVVILGLTATPQPSYADGLRCIDAHNIEALTTTAARTSALSALERLQRTEAYILVTHQGLPILVEITPPTDPSLPHVLLLPGVRRPVIKTDLGYMAIANKGYGVVSFSYSRQPFSLSLESTEGRAPIRNTSFKFEDLLKETNLVIEDLKRRGIHNIVPISLSFSASTSPYLKGFPLIIDTVPMTSWDAAVQDSNSLQQKKMLRTLQFWNPFLAPTIRQSMDNAYRENFRNAMDEQIKILNLDPKKRDEFVEGQMQLTRATEDANWSHAQLSPETRRVFILGLHDHPRLLRHQLETFKNMMITRPNDLLITIKEAGHFIPINQPVIFSGIVDWILSNPSQVKGGLAMIGSTIDDVTYITDPKEAAKRVQKLLNLATDDDIANTAQEYKTK